MDYKTISKLMFSGLVTGALIACSAELPEKQTVSGSGDQDYLEISFGEGPNQGVYRYFPGESPTAGVSLSYSKPNDVSFFAAADIKSSQGELQISSVRRFTQGPLELGDNSATTWLAHKPDTKSNKPMDCGRVEMRDLNNTQPYQVVYGTYLDCGATQITRLDDWQTDADGQYRRVEGRYEDRVRLQIAMDDAPFKTIDTTMVVAFSVLQRKK
ncbi:hypothetical protein GCM10008090_01930 [Arenicella chitinivorans]|uniref:Lipoprotein n=2 Tax=Arenicella chitinivorans TaxID=1329800 RepID=A0A918RJF3_9GAMM|nr:hypothetical protein GCM10008090_01930 [Arenicella chitinivorans]